jgi:hypothetical protein
MRLPCMVRPSDFLLLPCVKPDRHLGFAGTAKTVMPTNTTNRETAIADPLSYRPEVAGIITQFRLALWRCRQGHLKGAPATTRLLGGGDNDLLVGHLRHDLLICGIGGADCLLYPSGGHGETKIRHGDSLTQRMRARSKSVHKGWVASTGIAPGSHLIPQFFSQWSRTDKRVRDR